MIDIWHFPIPESLQKPLWESLSLQEKQKAQDFRFTKDQNRFIFCRALLRECISKYIKIPPREIVFSYGAYGKPYIHGIQFNLSHSTDYAVIGVSSETELGIDIEKIEDFPDQLEIANSQFNEDEYLFLKNTKVDERLRVFFELWTKKEARLKALGHGFAQEEDSSGNWNLEEINITPDYVCSLAYQGLKKKLNIKLIHEL